MYKSLLYKINGGVYKIGMCLLLYFVLNAQASVSVLSDIKVLGSSRGLAVSISADLPFDATFKKISKNSIRVILSDCVYGLSTFNFLNFKTGVPVVKINVKEIKTNSTVQIDIVVSDKLNLEIESQKKNNQWIALLSRNSCENFKWSALESDADLLKKSKAVQVQSGAAAVQTYSEPIRTVNVEKKLEDVQLVNVTVFQRNKICALSFELDNVAQSTIKRIKDTVFLQIPHAGIGLKNDKIEVPSGTPFSTIKIKQKKIGDLSFLNIVITLDKKNHVFQNGVVYKKGNTITFFSNSSSDEKLSQWITGKGLIWEQRLYDLPTYNSDMKTLEKRASKDAGGLVENSDAFYIKEKESSISKQNAVAEVKYDGVHAAVDTSETIASEVKTVGSKTAEPVLLSNGKKVEPLIVIANNVNLRAEPSVSAEVLSNLSIGDRLELLETKGLWDNVRVKMMTGWIHRKNVTDSSKVSAALWTEINGRQASIATVSESPMIKQEAELGEKIVSEIGDTLYSAGSSSDSGLNHVQKKIIKYNVIGRDPFLPLVTDTTGDSDDDANVENLRLVGVLIDNAEQIALFEDLKANRKPFALRENESVDHGKVLKIYKDKVVFLITEYGISRSYTIRLATKQE